MLVNIQGRKMELTPALKSYALQKITVLNKYLSFNLRVHVTLSVDKFRQRAEGSVNGKGVHLHGVEETEDMYEAIDKVMDKITRQARKLKEKRTNHRGKEERPVELPAEEAPATEIVRTPVSEQKPMSTIEALNELNERNLQFLVYRSTPEDKVNVLYHRSDGSVGLIES